MMMKNEVLSELSSIGKSLIKIAELLGSDEETKPTVVKQGGPVKEQETKPLPVCTLADLKEAFFNLSEKGKDSEAMALLAKHGYSKLSQVNEKDYQSLKEEAEAIANA